MGMVANEVQPKEITGKWQVWMVTADGLRTGEPLTIPNSFLSAMSFARGYLHTMLAEDIADGAIPMVLPVEPEPIKYVVGDRPSYMVGPELNFTRSCPSSAHVDVDVDVDVDQVNQELSEVAEVAAEVDPEPEVETIGGLEVKFVEIDGKLCRDLPAFTPENPEPYQRCHFPGWRFATEKDVATDNWGIAVTDDKDRHPETCPKARLLRIKWGDPFPFRCFNNWTFAYVKLDS